MRIAGIVLLSLGALLIASGVLQLAVRAPGASSGLPESQQRMDAFFPGAFLMVVGFVLTVVAKRKPEITAVAVEDWMPVTLTPAAAEFAHRAMLERKFAPGTGLRIEPDAAIKFDAPSDADEDLVGEDRGITVFVEKSLGPRFAGRVIDLIGGQLTVTSAPDVCSPQRVAR